MNDGNQPSGKSRTATSMLTIVNSGLQGLAFAATSGRLSEHLQRT